MRIRALATLAVLALLAATPDAGAQNKPPRTPAKVAAEAGAVVYSGATIHTGTGEVITDGTIVVAQGKIVQVGKGLTGPAGAQTVNVKGMVITPGFVDVLTSIGLVEVDQEPATHDDEEAAHDLIRAGFRAADGYNPASTVVGVTRVEGLTSAGVIPTGGLIAGQSAWVDLDGATAAEAMAEPRLALHVRLGGDIAGGRANGLLRVREAFDDARFFQRNRAGFEHNQARRLAPSRLDLEALSAALDGKVPVVFHVDRAADILSVLAVARELKLRPVIAGGAEAWKVARELSAAKVPVIVFPLAQPSSFDALGAREDNAARLAAAGVAVAISPGRRTTRASCVRSRATRCAPGWRTRRPSRRSRACPRRRSASAHATARWLPARSRTSWCGPATRSSCRRAP